MKNLHIFPLVAMIILFLAFSADATIYTFTSLNYPGAASTYAFGIDSGKIVGEYTDSTGGVHGFVYDGSTWTPLNYPGASMTHAFGIDGGNIVGAYLDLDSVYHGFLYNGSTYAALNYPGAASTYAYDIQGSNIVGWYLGADSGFLYDGSSWTPLNYPGADGTAAYGIDGNNIVGVYIVSSGFHGFLYQAPTYTSLDYPGASHTFARDIQGSNIVGSYSDSTSAHGFLFDGSNWTPLNYPGADATEAWGIDGKNIVGNYSDSTGKHGFLATPAIAVPVDIKPGACPNILNVKSKGVLPVAILGTGDFDVTQVDVSSVRLEGVGPLTWSFEDVSTPFEPTLGKQNCSDCNGVGPDGFMDLLLTFDTEKIVGAIGPVSDGECMVLSLSGRLREEFGGLSFEGEDIVLILKKGRQ